jgi:hypothetical protein
MKNINGKRIKGFCLLLIKVTVEKWWFTNSFYLTLFLILLVSWFKKKKNQNKPLFLDVIYLYIVGLSSLFIYDFYLRPMGVLWATYLRSKWDLKMKQMIEMMKK